MTTENAPSPIAAAPLAATAAALRRGEMTLEAYVNAACDHLDAHEAQVCALLPVPGRRARLVADARALATRFPDPSRRPSLYGALAAFKDIYAVDGFETRAGSALPPTAFAMPEGSAVTRLRAAGALILGKTVTTEFAYFDAGATTNPHDAARTPGGSSSGSAAAVACGYAPLAFGSQTVGSVLRPAAYCGVVGFKPSYGRLPTDGIVPYSLSVDTVGWFTQDVAGARLAASALLEGWREPAAQGALPVLGVPAAAYLQQAHPAALAAFEETLTQLQARGVQVRRVAILDDIEQINAHHRTLSTAEFGAARAEQFAEYGALFRSGSAALFDAAQRVTPDARDAGLASRGALRERLHAAMDAEGIDLWASPAAPGIAPLGLNSTGDPVMNLPWTHAGVPAIAIPAGTLEGMPLGLQLAGRFGADEALLSAVEALAPLA